MFNATVLMISRDRSLNRSVSRGINALQGFELRIVEGLDQIGTSIKEKGLDLVMVHLDGSMGYAQVARVLWMSSILPRPVPVLAVTERYRIQEALAMFRMGVADYVSRGSPRQAGCSDRSPDPPSAHERTSHRRDRGVPRSAASATLHLRFTVMTDRRALAWRSGAGQRSSLGVAAGAGAVDAGARTEDGNGLGSIPSGATPVWTSARCWRYRA